MTLAPLDSPVAVRAGGFQETWTVPGVAAAWTAMSWGGAGGPGGQRQRSFQDTALWQKSCYHARLVAPGNEIFC